MLDAQKWRERAHQYRVYAETCAYPDARASYMALAASCDELAERTAKGEGEQTAPSPSPGAAGRDQLITRLIKLREKDE